MSKRPLSDLPVEFVEKFEKLVAINEDYSFRYQSQALELKRYQKEHPTKLLVFKCMDGRILFSSFTETPLGFLRNFRNLGGQFNFGWRAFRDFLTAIVDRCYIEKRGCLAIITYHYSEGDKHRGCAGYGYDKEASIRGAMGFKKQLERAYKGLPHQMVPIVIGIETDEESLIIHGDNNEKLELAKLPLDTSEEQVFSELGHLFEGKNSQMSVQMRMDLLPLLLGNISHTHKVKASNRPIIEMNHGEWIVGVGGASAFDFLHVPNAAIIVGQYNPNLGKIIEKAFSVIKDNWKEGNKFFTLAGASYGQTNWGVVYEQHAMEDVRYYNRLIREIASKHYKELLPHMYQIRGLIDVETQKMKFV